MITALASRLLLGVTLAVAALLLAPNSALAHAGHSHASVPDVQRVEPVNSRLATQQVNPRESVNLMPVQAECSGETGLGIGAKTIWQIKPGSDTTAKICPGGCCNAAGASCCAVSLSDAAQILVPPAGRSMFDTDESRGAGIKPGALPEPPKFLS